ncbi:MAG: sensor histidine kinase [Gammaproteobacteria bacterium]|jgi:signal transduction histidine kinase
MASAEPAVMEAPLDFVETLANCIHDIKNSAGVVISAADAIALHSDQAVVDPHLTSLQTEARQINHNLMHLLGLYKLERSGCGISRDVVDCDDLILELQAHNDPLLAARGISFAMPDAEPIEGYFDRELVIGILNSAINNAQRYARSTLCVAASINDGYTVLRVDDDGPGYPEEVVEARSDAFGKTNYRGGSTGLGLFFARRIAAMHRHRDRIGHVTLSNEGPDGGASFRLWLP